MEMKERIKFARNLMGIEHLPSLLIREGKANPSVMTRALKRA
jgi:hypothetical protein